MDMHMEKQRMEKLRTEAFEDEVKPIKIKFEQQKVSEESPKRQLEDNLWREREKCDKEIPKMKKQFDSKC